MATETITATITMNYAVQSVQTDKGDSMHPPEWETRVIVEDLDIDGESPSKELRLFLIEFMKDRIK